jgi:hypothetical protein
MMKKISLTLLSFILMGQVAWADNDSGIGLSRGFSGIDGMNGYVLTGYNYWGSLWQLHNNWEFTGYWNTALSYWQTTRAKDPDYSNITILTVAPVLRFQRTTPYPNGIRPFLDAGYGLGGMNRIQFSRQLLGGNFTFVQTLGVGIIFGDDSQYTLSYHYLNYNNGGNLKHDDGLYANTIDFSYRFATVSK